MATIVFRQLMAVKYTGSNANECLALAQQATVLNSVWSIVSSTTDLVLRESRPDGKEWVDRTIPVGTYLVVAPDFGVLSILTEDQFNRRLRTATQLASDVAQGALGIANVPSMLGNASTTVQVAIKPILNSVPTNAVAILAGSSSILAALTVVATVPVAGSDGTCARVDVTIRNTGLITLSGGQVFVHCG